MRFRLASQGRGVLRCTSKDVKVNGLFQVGPRATYVTYGGLRAYAGHVPSIGVDVEKRSVTVGSIVRKQGVQVQAATRTPMLRV